MLRLPRIVRPIMTLVTGLCSAMQYSFVVLAARPCKTATLLLVAGRKSGTYSQQTINMARLAMNQHRLIA